MAQPAPSVARPSEPGVKPLPLHTAVALFAVPSALISWLVYVGMPYLDALGVPQYANFVITLASPLALMLVAALAALRLEGHPLSWSLLRDRFRLVGMERADWLWTAGLAVFTLASYATLGFTARWLIKFRLFAPPRFLLPIVDPRVAGTGVPSEFLGIPLPGAWWVAGVYLVMLFFNIFGEEFWWRGYILPRQEVQHGRHTWLIHGLMWTFFHVFWKWDLIVLLPTCLSLSYVAQRRKNTWPGIIVHFIINGVALIPLVLGILGVKG